MISISPNPNMATSFPSAALALRFFGNILMVLNHVSSLHMWFVAPLSASQLLLVSVSVELMLKNSGLVNAFTMLIPAACLF